VDEISEAGDIQLLVRDYLETLALPATQLSSIVTFFQVFTHFFLPSDPICTHLVDCISQPPFSVFSSENQCFVSESG
jgi:hypothetical protein